MNAIRSDSRRSNGLLKSAVPLAAGVPGRRQALGAGRATSRIQAALDHLVADQQTYARRVAEAITQLRRPARSGPVSHGVRPPRTTSRLDFLLREVIDDQERAAAAIEHCAAQLEGDSAPALPGRGNPRQRPRDIWTSSRK